MTPAANNFARLADDLGLVAKKEGLFIGKIRGFPVGVKCIDPDGSGLLLFQIRHPLPAGAKELSNIQNTSEIERLVAEKKIEISLEDKLAWLTFVEGAKFLADGSVVRLLNDMFGAFEKAGLAANPDICHYCRQNRVETLTCHEGKVAQICNTCLQEQMAASINRPADATAGAIRILILGPLAAIAGAICWALVWIGYDLLFELLKTNVIYVPRIVELVVLFCVAGTVGGPVGFVIKRIPRRGKALSVIKAVLCSVAAVVFGEVAYVVWLIYRELKVVSVSGALHLLPRLELEMGGFHLAIKLLAAALSVTLAVVMAKPAKLKLNL